MAANCNPHDVYRGGLKKADINQQKGVETKMQKDEREGDGKLEVTHE